MYVYNIHLESSPRLHCACCQGNAVAISLVKMLETSGTPTNTYGRTQVQ